MSRGGRGGARARGSRPKGAPELELYSSDEDLSPKQKKPEPLFPALELPTPIPPSACELAAVKHHLAFRTRTRNGPFFATLDPSSVADERTGKTLKRAGFDPFNDQETYASRTRKEKKRSIPDLAGRDYVLKFFPRELWSTLDPSHKSPFWDSLDSDVEVSISSSVTKPKSLKRKRDRDLPSFDASDNEDDPITRPADANAENEEEAAQTDDSDPLISSSRVARTLTKSGKKRRRGRTSTTNSSREKRGLDAEDEYGPKKKRKGLSPPVGLRAKERKRRKEEASITGRKLEEDSDLDEDDDGPDDHAAGEDHEEIGDDDDDDDDDDEEPEDSEFEESDEGEDDDYNGENYFNTGEGDDDDAIGFGGGGGDEGGDY